MDPLFPPLCLDHSKIGFRRHYLDSGSFSLWPKATKYAKKHPEEGKWGFYKTQEFWDYVDSYATFVKKYDKAIDFYSNVDVIPNGELSWEVQQHLEHAHHLSPIPVVHYKTDIKWLRHYLDLGYQYIALGMVRSTNTPGCQKWLDRCFQMICKPPHYLPSVKIHGFGNTTLNLMTRYPFYSVDSASWTLYGTYGGILVPCKRHGKFSLARPPKEIKVSYKHPWRKIKGEHLFTLPPAERAHVLEWLRFIGVPLGEMQGPPGEEIIRDRGVINCHGHRKAASIRFFEWVRTQVPEYPWPFRPRITRGFGIGAK